MDPPLPTASVAAKLDTQTLPSDDGFKHPQIPIDTLIGVMKSPPPTNTAASASGLPIMPSTNATGVDESARSSNADEVYNYMEVAKSTKPELFEAFLALMKDFSSKDFHTQTNDIENVTEKVSVIFNDHPELVQRFPLFLANLQKGISPPTDELQTMPPQTLKPVVTPRPATPAPPPQTSTPSEPVDPSRPLDVTDALSYLDAVKSQFWEKPDVYNNFLDIMKDFKCQVIDTPGVIERVSLLFHGHPDLIQGFNTFLPPGYRIECTTGPMEHNIITVTTPSGTTTQSTDETHPFRMNPGTLGLLHQTLVPPPMSTMGTGLPGSRPVTPLAVGPNALGSPSLFGGGSSSAHAASFLGGLNGKTAADKQGPPGSDEFHHAIQYVNKIKTRFEDDPDTYKQFLEILHTYRKEQGTRDDSQVFAQVQVLFKDAPDLLAEFKDFLPSAVGAGGFVGGSTAETQEFFMGHSSAAADRAEKRPAKPDVPQAAKRKKRPIEKEVLPAPAPVAPPPKASSSRTKKVKNKPEPQSPPFPTYHSHPPSPAHTYASAHQQQSQAHITQAAHPHALTHQHAHAPQGQHQMQASHHTPGVPTTVQDDVMFFDRAKRVLESREAYEDFLKLLSLFAKEIIDTKTLIQRAEAFLGDNDLLAQFKALLGWDDGKDGADDVASGAVRSWSVDSVSRPARETEERSGASYRRLPIAETRLACSGRDELCKSVLNDIWVSHPTWASEESGFVSHKKNSYEEALHKSEEERHEYQFYIDIITRTIALLQPLNDRILEMTAEERHSYRLPADFGGSSKSIYHRAIKKVYGRDGAGTEVLQALQECPGVAIPVVLPRLKQKNEEWRRAQREWNRVWREVDARNFLKSLDHQGITFKANDKKNITTKSFVAELEAAKAEVLERQAKAKGNKGASAGSQWHLQYHFSDTVVLQDALKLVFSFLDRSQAQYSPQERRAVERLLRSLVPAFFMLPVAEFDAAFGAPVCPEGDDGPAADEGGVVSLGGGGCADDVEEPSGAAQRQSKSGRRSAGGGTGGGGVPPGDLRKKLLKTVQEKAAKVRSASGSRQPSPVSNDEPPSPLSPGGQPPAAAAGTATKQVAATRGENEAEEAGEFWSGDEWAKLMPVDGAALSGAAVAFPAGTPESVLRLGRDGIIEQQPFFANTTFYTLFRLLQLLYSRLLLCKEITGRLSAADAGGSVFVVNPVAEELGLVDSSGPGAVLALAAHQSASGDGDVVMSDGRNGARDVKLRPEAHFYEYLLDACEKLFEGELEQVTFEENMRFLFGTKAYHVFTLDKVIAGLIKQAQAVAIDPKCQELLALLLRSRSRRETTMREVIRYRREAEQYLGPDDHLYRLEWVPTRRAMEIGLVGSWDASVEFPEGEEGAVGRWRVYAESYGLRHGTEMVSEGTAGRVRKPYLSRTRDEGGCGMGAGMVEIGISVDSWRVLYRNGGEDIVWRARAEGDVRELNLRAVARHEERRDCINRICK